MNSHPKVSELPRADDKLFTAIAATGDSGLSDDDYAQHTLVRLAASREDDAAATERQDAQAKQPEERTFSKMIDDGIARAQIAAQQAEEDMRILVERKRKQRGRRRADAILGALRAMEDAGLEPHQIDGFHADCAWAIADLLHAIAGEPDRLSQARPEAEAARGSAPAGRALHPNVEGGIAEMVADSERSEAR